MPAPPKVGEYRNLEKAGSGWAFEVKTKAGWLKLSGLSSETSQKDAEAFAQNTANSWRKK